MSDADYQAALEQQARAQNERSVMEAQWQAAQELRGAQHAPQAQNTVQALGSGGIGAGLGALATEMRRARGFNESKRLEKAMMEQGGSRQAGDIAGKILEKAIARDEREYNRGQDDIDNAFRNRQQRCGGSGNVVRLCRHNGHFSAVRFGVGSLVIVKAVIAHGNPKHDLCRFWIVTGQNC